MTTSFTDGTKMNIEQANVANAFNLLPEVRGMRGIHSNLATVTETVAANELNHFNKLRSATVSAGLGE